MGIKGFVADEPRLIFEAKAHSVYPCKDHQNIDFVRRASNAVHILPALCPHRKPCSQTAKYVWQNFGPYGTVLKDPFHIFPVFDLYLLFLFDLVQPLVGIRSVSAIYCRPEVRQCLGSPDHSTKKIIAIYSSIQGSLT